MGRGRRPRMRAVAFVREVQVLKGIRNVGRSEGGRTTQAYFAVCEPGRWVIGPDGLPTPRWFDATFRLFAVLSVVTAPLVMWILLSGTTGAGVGAVFGTLLGGGFAGYLAAVSVFAAVGGIVVIARRVLKVDVIRVERSDEAGWAVCEAVYGLSLCGAWRDGTVDPQRRIGDLLWTTLDRRRDVDARRDLLARAQFHRSLDDLAGAESSKLAREEAALKAAAINLSAVWKAAREIDRLREERTRKEAEAHARAAEERELRAKLLGSAGSVGPSTTEDQADVAFGLAAEAETIATLLAQTDELLNS